MKRIINIIIAFLGVAAVVQAQTENVNCKGCGPVAAGISQYAVSSNGNMHYRVAGCIPGSDVQFYSEMSGGNMVNNLVADASGHASLVLPAKTPVALIVNHNHLNEKGIAGNGMVSFIGAPLLQLDQYKATAAGSFVQLSWKAAATESGLKVTVERLAPKSPAVSIYNSTVARTGMTQYESVSDNVKDVANNGHLTYTIRVSNADGETLFTESVTVSVPELNWARVTPSVFENTISVQVPATRLPAVYTVFDLSGKNVKQQGRIITANQQINVNVMPGQYLLQVTDHKGAVSSEKIVRQ
jgi:hypothetical protein